MLEQVQHDWKLARYQFVKGITDSFNVVPAVITLYRSKAIQVLCLKCFLLNGVMFVGSIWLFDKVSPMVKFLFPSSTWFVEWLLSVVYHLLWVYPVYVISFILNTGWYMDISKKAYLLQVGKPIAPKATYSKVLELVTDEIYRTLLLLNFMALSSFLYLIPRIGTFISFVCFCWVSAIYSFDAKMANRGWSLETRLTYFEQHWVYFAGFGFPVTLLTFFIPQFVSYGIFAFLFPLYIIMANSAKPIPRPIKTSDSLPQDLDTFQILPNRLRIFKLSLLVNSLCIKRTFKGQ